MRLALVPAGIVLIAWCQPAGTDRIANATERVAVAGVTRPAAAASFDAIAFDETETTGLGPAETTAELDRVDMAIAKPEISNPPMLGDSLDALDAVAREPDLAAMETTPLPPRRPVPHARVCEEIAAAAQSNNLPIPFLIRLIWQESGFDQNAVSRAGALGVAQFMPETAAERGLVDPFNPLQAVRASAQLLRDLFHQFGSLGLAAAAYNAGVKRVQDWLAKRSPLPQETRDYVQNITGRAPEQWKGIALATPLRVPAEAPCQREAGLFAANGPRMIPMPPVAPDAAGPVPTKAAEATERTAKPRTTAARALAPPIVAHRRETKVAAKTATKTVSAKAAAARQVGRKDRKVRVAEASRNSRTR